MGVVVVTPSVFPLVPLALAQKQCKIDSGYDDAILSLHLNTACSFVDGPDGDLAHAVGVQTLRVTFDCFDAGRELPYPPIREIVAVTYLDADGETQPLDPSVYELVGDRDTGYRMQLQDGQDWPETLSHPDAVTVEFTAGYDEIPWRIQAAILLMTADLYANRMAQVAKVGLVQFADNPVLQRLLSRYRPPVVA